MSTAADHAHADDLHAHGHPAHLAHHFDTPAQQFSTGKLGMWTFLATEVLMFGGLFCAYAVYRYNHPQVYLWSHHALDATWGMINTIVLLASSFTMAWGVRAAQLNQKGLLQVMLALTFLGGVGFMCIKAVEYQQKWQHFLFPGEFNVLNVEFKAPEGQSADALRAQTIGYVEKHATGGGHGDSHGGGHGPAASPGHGDHGMTPVKPGEMPQHSDVSHDPAVKPAAKALTAVGTLVTAPDLGPDTANISAPTLVAAGTNPDADKKAGHHFTSYGELEPLDRSQLNTFFSIYFMMTGLHGIHVVVGMGILAWLFIKASAGHFSSQYFTPVDLGGLYWHLVDLIWIFLFPLLYLIH